MEELLDRSDSREVQLLANAMISYLHSESRSRRWVCLFGLTEGALLLFVSVQNGKSEEA